MFNKQQVFQNEGQEKIINSYMHVYVIMDLCFTRVNEDAEPDRLSFF